ncbi:hypothetical protein NDU88_001010 [Pleurodeles waltl]|uniref:Uncharacterized protein n=1 Tax=Pleurodeles waltl TaxID=8319 RepID=A0AAV7WKJ6_PLEWA|nr:hypothetical protein NDU88_001010 [Pleurodeles waltl]
MQPRGRTDEHRPVDHTTVRYGSTVAQQPVGEPSHFRLPLPDTVVSGSPDPGRPSRAERCGQDPPELRASATSGSRDPGPVGVAYY